MLDCGNDGCRRNATAVAEADGNIMNSLMLSNISRHTMEHDCWSAASGPSNLDRSPRWNRFLCIQNL